ncbi:MAG TPA: pectate lyase [Opitutaceae bacterium]|nr:pectate lyase [Opitutaceae bacterium]
MSVLPPSSRLLVTGAILSWLCVHVVAEPIPVDGFRSSISHWRKINEPQRVIQPLPDQPSYRPEQTAEIAGNIRLFQRANGGWAKDYDMLAILTEAQRAAVLASRDRNDTSFDNDSTYPQVEYLARVYATSGNPADREACLRGFDFMLSAQYENGGFPQKFPRPRGLSARITFNDGAMMGVLGVLRDAANGKPHFAWLDEERRVKAVQAVARGVDCILKCQIEVAGRLTGWGQQHDEVTFAPVAARSFELVSTCPQDTAQICDFLMELPNPSPSVVNAVDAAVAWMQAVQLRGVRLEKIAAEKAVFFRHTTESDFVVVSDPTAPPLWARTYEIGSDRTIFASRDGIKVYSFGEMDRERRTGTAWFGKWPQRVIDELYPRWKARQ